MAEWFKAAVLKTVVRETVPGVRIPLPPPAFAKRALRAQLRLGYARLTPRGFSDGAKAVPPKLLATCPP